MFGGFDLSNLSSLVEAGNKLKEEVESNIANWEGPKDADDSSSSCSNKPGAGASSSSSSDHEDAGQLRSSTES